MRQIFVDSRDRTSGTSTNFSVTLPQTLSLEGGHQGRVDDFRLPMCVPTIYEDHRSIVVVMGAQTYEVFLNTGQYSTGEALANEIRVRLAAAVPGSWSTQYNAAEMALGVQCSNPFTFVGGTFMKRLLERPFTVSGDGKGYNFPYVPLQGLDLVYLCCSNFGHMDNVGPKGASDCLCAIPITVPYGAVQTYSMSSSVFFDIPAITTQQLSFQVRDRDYNILKIVPNISFTLAID